MHLDGDEAGHLHDDHGQRDEDRNDAAGAVHSGAGEQSSIEIRTTLSRANQNPCQSEQHLLPTMEEPSTQEQESRVPVKSEQH